MYTGNFVLILKNRLLFSLSIKKLDSKKKNDYIEALHSRVTSYLIRSRFNTLILNSVYRIVIEQIS